VKALFLSFTMTDLTFFVSAGTDVGLVRTNNEDNFIVCPDLHAGEWFLPHKNNVDLKLGPYGSLLVVADGMGGMNAGEVASEIAVNSIKEAFKPEILESIIGDEHKMLKFMSDSVILADKNIKRKAREDNATSGMGTTIVMAWIADGKVFVCWCGDSRAYLFNATSGLVRLSKDHSFVQRLVDEGKLDSELAFDHPDSNIITRSLGDSSSAARPDTTVHNLAEGDIVLLCTDGLCGLCRDSQIGEIISRNTENVEVCRNSLFEAALANGGYDNMTLAILKVETLKAEKSVNSTFSDYNTILKDKSKKRRRLFTAAVLAVILIACLILVLF